MVYEIRDMTGSLFDNSARKEKPSHPDRSGTAMIDGRSSDCRKYYGAQPVFALLAAVLLLLGVPACWIGWRRGPNWLFGFGWTSCVFGGAALLVWLGLQFALSPSAAFAHLAATTWTTRFHFRRHK